jgi:uncharacterized membrane protein YqjE
MSTRNQPPRRENLLALVRRLVAGGVGLARLELQRGRQEIGERIGEARTAAIMFGIAAAFVFLSLIAFVNLVIALIALLLPPWAAALLALIIFIVAAALFALLGRRHIRSPVPEETIASVKEDVEWAKRLLRRE